MKSEVEILSHWTTNRFTFFFLEVVNPKSPKISEKKLTTPKSWPEIFVFGSTFKGSATRFSVFQYIFDVEKMLCRFEIAPCHLWTKRLGVASFWKPLVKTGNDELTPTPTNPKLPKKNWVILSHVTKGWMKPPFTKTTLKKWRLTICIMYIYIYMSLISFTHFVLSLVCFHCCMEDQSLETDSVIFATTNWESNMGPRRRALKKKH